VEGHGDDSLTNSISAFPYLVTTSPQQISSFLELQVPSVIFSTYHSAPRIAAAVSDSGHRFDLVICDEAHRVAGFRESSAKLPLQEQSIPAKRRLFQTATPRIFSPAAKQKALDRGVEPISMDAIDIFGPVFHQMSLRTAIDKGLLADYEVLVLGCDSAQAVSMIRERELVEIGEIGITSVDELAIHYALAKAQEEYGLRRTISFHSRVSRAADFADRHQALVTGGMFGTPPGKTWSAAISGYMSARRRMDVLQRLAIDSDDYGLVTNARCLSEGVDVPELDAVLFVDPKQSSIEVTQAVGRAIRHKQDGRIGRVIVPVLIAEDEDGEPTLETAGFQRVIEVVTAMRTHDGQLGDELDAIRFKLGRRSETEPQLPSHIRFQMPMRLSEQSSSLLSKIRLEVLDGTSSSWEYWFGELSRFVDIYGHARPNKRNPGLGHPFVGTWVVNQRRAMRGGWLSQSRQSRLEALPGWSWSQRAADVAVEDHFRLVREYVSEHGNLPEIKNRSKLIYKGQDLVEAVRWIRAYHRKGRMSDEWEDTISALPGWSWNTSNDASWELGYQQLVRFIELQGHADVPQYHIQDGFALGIWVANQRNVYRSKDRQMRRDRLLRLESLRGWTWNHLDASFAATLDALRSFYEREGHYAVPKKHIENGVLLGGQIRNLKTAFKDGRLVRERIQLIESLPGWEWRTSKRRRPNLERRMAERNVDVLIWYSSLEPKPSLKSARHLGTTVAGAFESLQKQIEAGTLRDDHKMRLLQLDPETVNRLFLQRDSRVVERDVQVLTWYSSQIPRPPIRKARHRGVTVEGAIKSLQRRIEAGTLRDDDRTRLLQLDPKIVNRLFP